MATATMEHIENLVHDGKEANGEYRIALYYFYCDLSPNVESHVSFHRQLCESLNLKGRIRISHEGINGVLSGRKPNLERYETAVAQEVKQLLGDATDIDLDVKYCILRDDIPIESQLFDTLLCKETKTVISLFDQDNGDGSRSTKSGRSKQANRRRRRKEERRQQNAIVETPQVDFSNLKKEMMNREPARHLSAEEWNEKLKSTEKNKALLLDVRNVYESRVGHFSTSNVPTLLTNTRKYSDLPHLLASNQAMEDKEKEAIFMYCTGGVRCERVSQMVQQLYPEKKVFQLKGGIQTYLRETTEQGSCLFKGKNFVFDPRRTDPVHFGEKVGRCTSCNILHDDYDNGHTPSENKEARCNTCRMLVLVCNDCRPKYTCWGEEQAASGVPLLYCGLERCVHEGAAPQPELLESTTDDAL